MGACSNKRDLQNSDQTAHTSKRKSQQHNLYPHSMNNIDIEYKTIEIKHQKERFNFKEPQSIRQRISKEYQDGFYEGEMQFSEREGQGTMYYKNKNKYSGGWNHDQKSGEGTMYADRLRIIIQGHFRDDMPNGKGVLTDLDSNYKYEGEFHAGMAHGKGTLIENNIKYTGFFKMNKKSGLGVEQNMTKNKKYEGQFKDNFKHGIGIWTDDEGKRLKQVYEHGELIQSFADDS